jgi:transcriptional regulator with XRE-family HTH domain
MSPQSKDGMSLGQCLDQARNAAGLSYRRLAAMTGIPFPSIQRLINDEVNEPSPEYLTRLAKALELNAADLFLLAGLPLPDRPPSIEAMLRTEYDLPEEAITEARQQIQAIVAKYNGERAKSQD